MAKRRQRRLVSTPQRRARRRYYERLRAGERPQCTQPRPGYIPYTAEMSRFLWEVWQGGLSLAEMERRLGLRTKLLSETDGRLRREGWANIDKASWKRFEEWAKEIRGAAPQVERSPSSTEDSVQSNDDELQPGAVPLVSLEEIQND